MNVVYDTALGERVQLIGPKQGRFTMYVCGPTVDNSAHLGHGRLAIVFDLLRRHLEKRGVEVVMVQNITDVDDKIIDRAKRSGRTPMEVAREFEAAWFSTLDRLRILRPTHSPRATEWIPQMIGMIAEMVDNGSAYRISDGVYLSVDRVEGYPRLSRQDRDELLAGARVEVSEEKRSPLDFALWKLASAQEYGFDSPWGWGRPGWHTECVAMSLGLLGEGFDLHGGGMDLVFPHHENEWAQAAVLGKRFCRHWMHNGLVEMAGEKMSKSIGNTMSLAEALDRYGPRPLRLAYLRAQYRSPLEMGEAVLDEAERALERIDDFIRRVQGAVSAAAAPKMEEFAAALDDDLDTPRAFAILFEAVRAGNAAIDAGQLDAARALAGSVAGMLDWVGIGLERLEIPGEIAELVAERERAKASRDYVSADRIRERLGELGYVLKDTRDGPVISRA